MKQLLFIVELFLFSIGTLLAVDKIESSVSSLAKIKKEMMDAMLIGSPSYNSQKAGELQKLYTEKLKEFISQALKEPNYESENSLLNTLLKQKELNPQVIWLALKYSNNNDFSIDQVKTITEVLTKSMALSVNDENLEFNIKTLLMSEYCQSKYFSNLSLDRLKSMMKRSRSNNSLFIANLLDLQSQPEVLELLKAKANKLGNTFSSEYMDAWLSLCILARYNDKEAIEKSKLIAQNISNDNSMAMNFVPVGLAYTEQKELIKILFEMLKSDKMVINGEDVDPPKTQLAHGAAAALSLIIEGFPNHDRLENFSELDKKRCIDWVEKNKDNYKIINRTTGYFMEHTVLGYL